MRAEMGQWSALALEIVGAAWDQGSILGKRNFKIFFWDFFTRELHHRYTASFLVSTSTVTAYHTIISGFIYLTNSFWICSGPLSSTGLTIFIPAVAVVSIFLPARRRFTFIVVSTTTAESSITAYAA